MPLNRADRDFEMRMALTDHERAVLAAPNAAQEKLRAEQAQSGQIACTREQTVAEAIDSLIAQAERRAQDLRTLKDNLSRKFLASGASEISSLLLDTK